MGFWSNTQDRLVVGRKVEEQLYSQALNELESGVRRDGLWAKALAASEGDDARAKAQYISLVVQALKDETHIEKRSLREAATRAKEKQIPEEQDKNTGLTVNVISFLVGSVMIIAFVASLSDRL